MACTASSGAATPADERPKGLYPAGEDLALVVAENLYAEIDRAYGTFDTFLVGRQAYEEMFAYWPGAETEEGGSETNKSMAHKTNTYKKFVISSGAEDGALEWNNAERVIARTDEDIARFINDLKSQPGADRHLSGGCVWRNQSSALV